MRWNTGKRLGQKGIDTADVDLSVNQSMRWNLGKRLEQKGIDMADFDLSDNLSEYEMKSRSETRTERHCYG